MYLSKSLCCQEQQYDLLFMHMMALVTGDDRVVYVNHEFLSTEEKVY